VNPHSKYKNTVAQFQTIPSLWLEKISKKFLSCLKARVKNSRPFFQRIHSVYQKIKPLATDSFGNNLHESVWTKRHLISRRNTRTSTVRTLWRRSTGGGIDPRGSPLPHLDTGPTSKSTPALPFRPSHHARSHDRRTLLRTSSVK